MSALKPRSRRCGRCIVTRRKAVEERTSNDRIVPGRGLEYTKIRMRPPGARSGTNDANASSGGSSAWITPMQLMKSKLSLANGADRKSDLTTKVLGNAERFL